MTFIEFCEAHGIIIDKPPRLGVWERYATEAHPRKRNGAVKWMGDYGFLQDHAIHTEVQFWRTDKPVKIDAVVTRMAIAQASDERRRLQENAAMRASMIVNKCVIGTHEYLKRKGFPKEKGLLWYNNHVERLVIPMYNMRNHLVGMQIIDEFGGKKFLYGQQTSGANFIMGQGDVNILCEGYATGLSIREAARALKHSWRIHVCFSAGNLVPISKALRPGIVVADNDKSGTGERVARETGWRYWISDREGEDFNDTHQRIGLHHAAQSLWRLLYPSRGGGMGTKSNLLGAIATRKAGNEGHPSLKGG